MDICAYSDGSSEGHGRSSWGFVLQREGRTFYRNSGPLHGSEVFDAEITGALRALESAITFLRDREHIYVLLDNQAAVTAIRTGISNSNVQSCRRFYNLAKQGDVTVRWVPGHSQIRGNEEADAAARAALVQIPNRQTNPKNISQAFLRRLMQQRRQIILDKWWERVCPERYNDLDLQMRRRKPPELALPRVLLHHLIAARTGHGDFAAYHRRFKHENATLLCVCGKETNPTHFIRCVKHSHLARRFKRSLPHYLLIRKLLGPKCLESFTYFARETGCFGKPPNDLFSAPSEDFNF